MFKVGGTGTSSTTTEYIIGIDVESEQDVGAKMRDLAASKASGSTSSSSQGQGQPPTVVLAQRIIQNAFNFLASFSGTAGPGGIEIVPLKAFEEWWKKFESRVRADPSFLEKQQD